MGAIRGILLVFVSVLLFILLLAGNLLLTLALSLNYDNVKTEFSSDILDSVAGDVSVKGIIEKNIPIMQLYCENKTEFSFEDFNIGKSFTIPCDVVAQGSEAIIDYGLNSFIEEIYYEDYDCGFWDCFEKTGSPSFLISEKAHNYWNNKFYLMLLISVALVGLMFFLVEKKSNTFILSGALLIVSSLPFMKLDSVLSLFSDNSLLGLLAVFFAQSYTVFLIMLISGVLVLIVGIVMKFFGVGFTISNLFKGKGKEVSKKDKKISKNEVKQIVKKGVFKNKKSDSVKKEVSKKEKSKKSK